MRKKNYFLEKLLTIALAIVIVPIARANSPEPNPYLGALKYAITHFDSAQTDSFPYQVKPGTHVVSPPAPLQVPQVLAGPINMMTLASTSPKYMWGVSTTGVSYIYTAHRRFTPVARQLAPGMTQTAVATLLGLVSKPVTSVQQALNIMSQIQSTFPYRGLPGIYSVVDRDNTLYTNYGNTIYAFVLNNSHVPQLGIRIARTLDASSFLQSGELPAGVVMTYDGKLVIVGTHSATIVDRSFIGPTYTVSFGSNETISNSAAVDEKNGIYVVTDKALHKLVWTGTSLSQNEVDGAWSSPYGSGDTYPTIFKSGSGSTPTLMGFGNDPDKLVVITDGLKRMNLVAFWRDAIPAGFTSRIAGQIPVTCGLPDTYQIQSDQSVAVNGYGAFVVNNVSASDGSTGAGIPALPAAFIRGPLLPSPTGVERFAWDPIKHSWGSVWKRPDISSNTMVPAISAVADNGQKASDKVFVDGYYSDKGWVVKGLDWNTGTTVHETVIGKGVLGNGFYANLQFFPNGDLLFNSVIGPTRIQLPSGHIKPW